MPEAQTNILNMQRMEAQQLGLNIPWRNILGIGCENFNTTGEFSSDIVCKLTNCVNIFAFYS